MIVQFCTHITERDHANIIKKIQSFSLNAKFPESLVKKWPTILDHRAHSPFFNLVNVISIESMYIFYYLESNVL